MHKWILVALTLILPSLVCAQNNGAPAGNPPAATSSDNGTAPSTDKKEMRKERREKRREKRKERREKRKEHREEKKAAQQQDQAPK